MVCCEKGHQGKRPDYRLFPVRACSLHGPPGAQPRFCPDSAARPGARGPALFRAGTGFGPGRDHAFAGGRPATRGRFIRCPAAGLFPDCDIADYPGEGTVSSVRRSFPCRCRPSRGGRFWFRSGLCRCLRGGSDHSCSGHSRSSHSRSSHSSGTRGGVVSERKVAAGPCPNSRRRHGPPALVCRNRTAPAGGRTGSGLWNPCAGHAFGGCSSRRTGAAFGFSVAFGYDASFDFYAGTSPVRQLPACSPGGRDGPGCAVIADTGNLSSCTCSVGN